MIQYNFVILRLGKTLLERDLGCVPGCGMIARCGDIARETLCTSATRRQAATMSSEVNWTLLVWLGVAAKDASGAA